MAQDIRHATNKSKPLSSFIDKATCLIVIYDRYLRVTRVALVNTTS
jgi:hypothetical protein